MTVLVTGAGGSLAVTSSKPCWDADTPSAPSHITTAAAVGAIYKELNLDLRSRLDIRLGEVTDPYVMRELVMGCEVVFHLAALIGIPYSYSALPHTLPPMSEAR